MPTTTTLVALSYPGTGDPVAAGAEIDLTDEDYAALRADGKVAASAQEQAANQQTAGPEGVYNARTTREEAPTPAETATKAKK